jgi:hypothetical protein
MNEQDIDPENPDALSSEDYLSLPQTVKESIEEYLAHRSDNG